MQQGRDTTNAGDSNANKEASGPAAAKGDAEKRVNKEKAQAKEVASTSTPEVNVKVEPKESSEEMQWTLDEDAILWAMKADDKDWSAIAGATGKSETAAKSRWRSLVAERAEDAKSKSKDKANGENPTVATVAPAAAPGAILPDDASDTDPYVEGNKASGRDVADPVLAGLDAGEKVLDGREAMLLTRLHDYYETAKWVAIAAKFYDETGRRIEPEALRHQLDKCTVDD